MNSRVPTAEKKTGDFQVPLFRQPCGERYWGHKAGHVARMGESRGVYRGLEAKPKGKRPLGRPKRTWEDNIKMDL